jgi:hypothetical protein
MVLILLSGAAHCIGRAVDTVEAGAIWEAVKGQSFARRRQGQVVSRAKSNVGAVGFSLDVVELARREICRRGGGARRRRRSSSNRPLALSQQSAKKKGAGAV